MQKVCPKAIQSVVQLAAIIKWEICASQSASPALAKLQLTPWTPSQLNWQLYASISLSLSLRSSSCSNIMLRPNISAVSEFQSVRPAELSTLPGRQNAGGPNNRDKPSLNMHIENHWHCIWVCSGCPFDIYRTMWLIHLLLCQISCILTHLPAWYFGKLSL